MAGEAERGALTAARRWTAEVANAISVAQAAVSAIAEPIAQAMAAVVRAGAAVLQTPCHVLAVAGPTFASQVWGSPP